MSFSQRSDFLTNSPVHKSDMDDAEFYNIFKTSIWEKEIGSQRPADKRQKIGANSSIMDENENMQQKLEAVQESRN